MGHLKAFNEDQVLDRAVDCFRQYGYKATSVRDLAETCNKLAPTEE